VLTKRLNWVKGQCAFLAGHGIQGDLLAAVLIRSSSALLMNRRTLAQSIKYLYDELGCTLEVGEACFAIGHADIQLFCSLSTTRAEQSLKNTLAEQSRAAEMT